MGSTLSPEFQRALEAEVKRLSEMQPTPATAQRDIQRAVQAAANAFETVMIIDSLVSAPRDSKRVMDLLDSASHELELARNLVRGWR